MNEFLIYRTPGLFFALPTLAIQGFYSGISRTKIILFYSIATAVINVFLDYCLIFGNYGFPNLGLKGAAIASVSAEAIAFLIALIYMKRDKLIQHYEIFRRFTKNPELTKSLLTLSWPMMFQGAISTGVWTIYFFFIEQMGVFELHVSQVIRNFYLIALIPVLGLGIATRTFVSQLIAEKRIDEVRRTVLRIVFLSFASTFIITLPNLIAPEKVISIISIDSTIYATTALTLRIVTGAMLLMALITPLLNLLTGAGATRSAFLIEIISISFYLVFASYLTIWNPQEIWIVWCLEYVYFGTMGIMSYILIRISRWKEIVV